MIVYKILFLLPNLVAFISQRDKNVWFFNYHLLTCSVQAKDDTLMFDAKYRYVFIV